MPAPSARRWLAARRERARQATARKAQTPRLLAHYGAFVRPGDLVFDVGANVGERTDVFLALGARVVAVEPQPACAARLRERFAGAPVTVVEAALAAQPGTQRLTLSSETTVASMAPEWIAAMRASGRFGEVQWGDAVEVTVTTLDELLAAHGTPAFCKIDVEGYEPEVLAGLSTPLPALSFEFAAEVTERAIACVRRLSELGVTSFTLSRGENLELETPWTDAAGLTARLEGLGDPSAWGDVYARGEL